jgi:ribosomal protein S18 acetylase RimI-like enzyme
MINIRMATPEDGVQAAPLIKIVFDEMEIPELMAMPVADVNAVFAESFKVAAFRYSYAHTMVAEEDGELVGICVGYLAEDEDHIDDAFAPFLPQVGITDGRELFPDHESFPGEWYLDLLAVKATAQHRGIGTKLLKAACTKQQAASQRYVGLCCDLVNPKAEALYSRLGFVEDGRVKIFAHEYRHMRKDLTQDV